MYFLFNLTALQIKWIPYLNVFETKKGGRKEREGKERKTVK
jgi:hypothetical protein